MSTETRRAWKQLRRAALYGEQNGLCWWCEEPMRLLARYPKDGILQDSDCTIDHLRDRDNPTRRELPATGERRLVAACYGCNRARDVSKTRTNNRLKVEIRA